jgi:hypothetical protein
MRACAPHPRQCLFIPQQRTNLRSAAILADVDGQPRQYWQMGNVLVKTVSAVANARYAVAAKDDGVSPRVEPRFRQPAAVETMTWRTPSPWGLEFARRRNRRLQIWSPGRTNVVASNKPRTRQKQHNTDNCGRDVPPPVWHWPIPLSRRARNELLREGRRRAPDHTKQGGANNTPCLVTSSRDGLRGAGRHHNGPPLKVIPFVSNSPAFLEGDVDLVRTLSRCLGNHIDRGINCLLPSGVPLLERVDWVNGLALRSPQRWFIGIDGAIAADALVGIDVQTHAAHHLRLRPKSSRRVRRHHSGQP